MNISKMKYVDKYMGFILCVLVQPLKPLFLKKKSDLKNTKKILALKFWGIGSIMLTSASLKEVKKKYPAARIEFLTLKENYQVCKMIEVVDEVVLFELKKNVVLLTLEIFKLIFKLRKKKYDIILDFEFYTHFSALVTFASGAKWTVGFQTWEIWRGKLHNRGIPFNHYWHVIENFNNLAVGKATNKNRNYTILPEPKIDSESKEKLVDKLNIDKLSIDDCLILVNVNCGELAIERRWPGRYFIELSNYLLSNYDVKLIFVGSEKEEPYVTSIYNEITDKDNAFNFAGKIDLMEFAALLEKSKLFITVDSGPLHLAAAIGVPTVSFFGPETPLLYGPRGEQHKVFFADISCSPCINVKNIKTVKCSQSKASCMEAIKVSRVVNEIENKYNFPKRMVNT